MKAMLTWPPAAAGLTWPPAAAGPAVRAAHSGLSGRRVQAMVIGLVLLVSTAASTLALGLLVDSNAPFDKAFAAQHGSDVTATVQATTAQLAATAKLPGVTAAAGPFPEATVTATFPLTPPPGQSGPRGGGGVFQTQLTVVGRPSAGGPVDDLTLDSGHWPAQPDQIVLNDVRGPGEQIGGQLTVTGVAGSPKLTIVGFARSITGTAQAWVLPAEVAALRAPGAADVSQMLYRFSSAATGAELDADIAAVRAALPHGSVLGAQTYQRVKLEETSSIAPWVPFIVAFGVLGLVMSALIVANVVSGAVVAGTRRIGVLKSVGFSPGQVVASYVIQVAVPAFAGCVLGVVGGNLLAVPLLGQTAQLYGVGALAVPVWVNVAVPLVMLGLTGATAVLLALRAGRMSAVQAIATGRAPRPKHGYAAHRVLGRDPWARLPRSVTIGLAGPFARPTRTAITLAAILFGAVAVTFGLGLVATLTLLLVAVAGLGVLNTVVLQTRERVHDLGVFKAIGMTPRQTIAMVVCSVAGIGLVAGLIGIPAGIAVHNYVLPVMGHAAQTNVPPSVLNVYQPAELVLLALSGLVIAVAGALGPAGWAARTRTAFALRAE